MKVNYDKLWKLLIDKFEYYCTMRRGVKNPFVAGCLFQ